MREAGARVCRARDLLPRCLGHSPFTVTDATGKLKGISNVIDEFRVSKALIPDNTLTFGVFLATFTGLQEYGFPTVLIATSRVVSPLIGVTR